VSRIVGLSAFVLIAISLPTNQQAFFDGLPFSGVVEIVGLVLLMSPLVVGSLRQTLINQVLSIPRRNIFRIYCVVAIAASLKITLFLVASTSGSYEVCYRSYSARSGVPCSPTFEPVPAIAERSELFDQRSTELSVIDFNSDWPSKTTLSSSNWRVPTVNSLAFDDGFWGWEPNDKQIEVFPFFAEFRGRLSLKEDEKLLITYIGQGRVLLANSVSSLEASYQNARTLTVNGPLSDELLVIDYSFLRTARNSEEMMLPYAALKVEKLSGGHRELARPNHQTLLRMVGMIPDFAIASVVALAYWLLRKHRKEMALALSLGALGLALVQSRVVLGVGTIGIEAHVAFILFATLYVLLRRKSIVILAPAYLATSVGLVIAEIESVTGSHPNLGSVLVRLRGNDHLVYHGLAREMLSSGFLRGGEDVYYYQPGIRYVFYLQQLLFGESGVLTGTTSVFAVGLGILCVARRLDSCHSLGRSAQIIGVLSLVLWWSSSHTTQSSILGLSEFATWILLLTITAVLLGPLTHQRIVVIAIASAAIIWIRPNQGLAVTVIVTTAFVLCLRGNRNSKSHLVTLMLVFFGALILIPLHNLVFGQKLAFLPGGHQNAGQASWDAVVRALFDESARSFLVSQIRGIGYLPTVLPDIYSPRLALSFAGFVVAMSLAIVGFVMSKPHRDWKLLSLGLLALVAQITPFLKYTIYRYYPIHNIAIYLTGLLMLLMATSLDWRRMQKISASENSESADVDTR